VKVLLSDTRRTITITIARRIPVRRVLVRRVLKLKNTKVKRELKRIIHQVI
jgi:hypothetical protein